MQPVSIRSALVQGSCTRGMPVSRSNLNEIADDISKLNSFCSFFFILFFIFYFSLFVVLADRGVLVFCGQWQKQITGLNCSGLTS